ncbi:endonuclease/exonuclease/phosphatase family protein [Sanyastnella coralliicola]|uniref:endonuclease/exonuclease/phosphatase family protein n=1 Tax=Sanyastnella coralliicola TaxID=3069118 RepID=UPI0027B9DC83|nr:endonuclease/exonuclease/phosphatase family protein [Longitalea sp. SCSIO 12813]
MTILFTLTCILFLAVLFSLSGNRHWIFRVPEFLYHQILVVALVQLVTTLVLGSFSHWMTWLTVIMLLFITVWTFYRIFPYTRMSRSEIPDADVMSESIRIYCANVEMGNDDYDSVLKQLNQIDPDIIVFLEYSEDWKSAVEPQLSLHPFRELLPLANTYGIALYSKIPITHSEIQFLVEQDVPSIFADFEWNKNLIRGIFLHPAPPSPTQNETSRERDSELHLAALKIETQTSPTIVCGDLNDVAWSRSTRWFKKKSGLKDPRVGRGMFKTFHARWPICRFPLDHIFVSDHFTLKDLSIGKNNGSDHFPLTIDLVLSSPLHSNE